MFLEVAWRPENNPSENGPSKKTQILKVLSDSPHPQNKSKVRLVTQKDFTLFTKLNLFKNFVKFLKIMF